MHVIHSTTSMYLRVVALQCLWPLGVIRNCQSMRHTHENNLSDRDEWMTKSILWCKLPRQWPSKWLYKLIKMKLRRWQSQGGSGRVILTLSSYQEGDGDSECSAIKNRGRGVGGNCIIIGKERGRIRGRLMPMDDEHKGRGNFSSCNSLYGSGLLTRGDDDKGAVAVVNAIDEWIDRRYTGGVNNI